MRNLSERPAAVAVESSPPLFWAFVYFLVASLLAAGVGYGVFLHLEYTRGGLDRHRYPLHASAAAGPLPPPWPRERTESIAHPETSPPLAAPPPRLDLAPLPAAGGNAHSAAVVEARAVGVPEGAKFVDRVAMAEAAAEQREAVERQRVWTAEVAAAEQQRQANAERRRAAATVADEAAEAQEAAAAAVEAAQAQAAQAAQEATSEAANEAVVQVHKALEAEADAAAAAAAKPVPATPAHAPFDAEIAAFAALKRKAQQSRDAQRRHEATLALRHVASRHVPNASIVSEQDAAAAPSAPDAAAAAAAAAIAATPYRAVAFREEAPSAAPAGHGGSGRPGSALQKGVSELEAEMAEMLEADRREREAAVVGAAEETRDDETGEFHADCATDASKSASGAGAEAEGAGTAARALDAEMAQQLAADQREREVDQSAAAPLSVGPVAPGDRTRQAAARAAAQVAQAQAAREELERREAKAARHGARRKEADAKRAREDAARGAARQEAAMRRQAEAAAEAAARALLEQLNEEAIT
jgi:hypothetical protein